MLLCWCKAGGKGGITCALSTSVVLFHWWIHLKVAYWGEGQGLGVGSGPAVIKGGILWQWQMTDVKLMVWVQARPPSHDYFNMPADIAAYLAHAN